MESRTTLHASAVGGRVGRPSCRWLRPVWTTGCNEPVPQDPNIIIVAVVNSPNNLDPRIGTDEISQRRP